MRIATLNITWRMYMYLPYVCIIHVYISRRECNDYYVERQHGIKRNRERGGRKRSRRLPRCRHLGHGTHFASLISRKDSVRVTGVFRLQAGAPGDPRLLRSLTVWYLNSKTRASQPTPFLSFLIVLVSLAAFPNVFPSFLILPSNLTSAPPRPPPHPPCPPPSRLPPSGAPRARLSADSTTLRPPSSPRSHLVPRRLSQ